MVSYDKTVNPFFVSAPILVRYRYGFANEHRVHDPLFLPSIYKKDAAKAASLSNAGRAISLPRPSPYLSSLGNHRWSKGRLAPNEPEQQARFFPAFQLTGVSVGALRFRMRCSKKSENLKIVQNQHSAAQFSHLQLVLKFVSRRFSASITIYLHLHKQQLYAISLHWQCVPSHFDHMLEVAS